MGEQRGRIADNETSAVHREEIRPLTIAFHKPVKEAPCGKEAHDGSNDAARGKYRNCHEQAPEGAVRGWCNGSLGRYAGKEAFAGIRPDHLVKIHWTGALL